jgi:hypothetical protein
MYKPDTSKTTSSRRARRGSAALVQEYVPSVDAQGEVGVYVIDGISTHMICKAAVLVAGAEPRDDFTLVAEQRVEIRPLDRHLGRFAEALVRNLPGPLPTYARVDLVESANGPLLLELELIEPVLFLDRAPKAVGALVRAIARKLYASR